MNLDYLSHMTLARLRQDRGIEIRVAQIFGGAITSKNLKGILNSKIAEGSILMPQPDKSYRPTLEETLELAQDPESRLLFLSLDPLFTGGYAENKPSKQSCYDLFSHSNLKAGKHFVHAFYQATDRVEFPNKRVGYSWAPEITTERADKRRRIILEVSRVVGTILSADTEYTSDITLNGYNPRKKLRARYRPGMKAVLALPSVEFPGKTHTLELLGMPVFPKEEVGAHLREEQATQTYNFCPYDSCDYKVPFDMSFSRQPVTGTARANVQEELIIDHHGKASIDAYIRWIRSSEKDFQVPNLLPDARPELIELFWNLYERAYYLEQGRNVSVKPLQMWMINRLLMNYQGQLNEQKK
jgi:hypothetical protein